MLHSLVTETNEEICLKILCQDLYFSKDPWPKVSETAKDLIRKLLVRDPKKRLTAHEALCEFSDRLF